MKKPVVFFHSDMEPDVRRIMSDPAPQGDDALTRALLNGFDVVYTSDVVRFEDMQIVRSSPANFFSVNISRVSLDAIYATKRRLGARDLFFGIPSHSLGMLGGPQ